MKHRIKSDNRARFMELWDTLIKMLNEVGEMIVKTKVNMVTYNNDYDGYKPRYNAVIWTKREKK